MIMYGRVINLLLFSSFFILLNCTYAQKSTQTGNSSLPEWVNNPHKFYPNELYIVGVGTGDTRKAAENNASGNIAKVFLSDIKVDQTIIEKYFESEGGGESELSFSSQLLRQTSVASQQRLKNIIIDKAHFSSEEGIYYVLVYLDRAETEELYKKDIQNNNKKITGYFSNYKNIKNKLNKFAFLSKAKTITEVNEILTQQYQIISTSGKDIPPAIPKSELDKEMRLLLDQISVDLISEGNTPNEIGDYLKETIGEIGFKIVKSGGDFSFKYQLNIEPTELNRENTVAFNWKLTIQVKDNINNYALKAFNIKRRTVSISEEEARAKIMRKVKEQLNINFYKQFLNYINSL